MVIHSGIARGRPVGTVGTVLGGFPESGRSDPGIPRETGVSALKVLPARKNLSVRKSLPAWKILPALWQ